MNEIGQLHALGLLVTDSFRWKHGWATWRIRFHFDDGHRGLHLHELLVCLHERALAQCQHRAECDGNMLYLLATEDVKSVFRTFGAIRQGLGRIAAIQSRASFQQAVIFAAELTAQSHNMKSATEAEAMALPDLRWNVAGFGLSRVAVTYARGWKVTVRLGSASGQATWVVDVNGQAACAHFHSRGDAVSKMGVAAALKVYETRICRQTAL